MSNLIDTLGPVLGTKPFYLLLVYIQVV